MKERIKVSSQKLEDGNLCIADGGIYHLSVFYDSLKLRIIKNSMIKTIIIPVKNDYYNTIPVAMAIDIQKQLIYFVHSTTIDVLNFSDKTLLTLCGKQDESGNQDGVGENARFCFPEGLAFDEENRILYVADTINNAIRQVFVDEKKVETLTGGGRGYRDSTLQDSLFHNPNALCFNSSTREIYVTDKYNYMIRKISLDMGMVSTSCGGLGGYYRGLKDGIGNEAHFGPMNGITIDEKNNCLYVTENTHSVIRKVDMSGEEVRVTTLCGCKGDERSMDGNDDQARFYELEGIAYDPNTNSLYVRDRDESYNYVVRRISMQKADELNG